MRMKTLVPIALLAAAPCASAQLAIDWHTIDSGSGVLSGGPYEVRGTSGQPDAGEVRTNYVSASGGFWSFGYVFCLADLTTPNAPIGDPLYGVPDGTVTAVDIQYYVNLWVAMDPAADLTTPNAPIGSANYGVPDGTVTAVDIQFYVNAWVAGCP